MYKAKNVDTDKALEAIKQSRELHRSIIAIEIKEKNAYLQGLEKGLDIAESIFECSNYEKDGEG